MTRIRAGALELDHEIRGEGPPLLMINGFRRSRVVWLEPFLSALEPHHQLVLFDNRGTGHSDQPEGGYTIEVFADDCAALLEALNIPRAHVFGTSMGGMIAQSFALRHPGRVDGLAIGCSSCGKGSEPAEKRIWELLRLTPTDEMDAREVAFRQEEAYVTEAFRKDNRPLLDRLFEVVNENPTPLHAIQGHLAAIEGWDACGEVGNIRVPSLVITGAEDRLIPAGNSRMLAERIPGALLDIQPDCAHFFWIEKPRETAESLIRFFSGLD